MAKNKISAIKLFDTRKPLCYNNCGRQRRWCSCFLESKTEEPKQCNHSILEVDCKDLEVNQERKSVTEPHCESENSSSKENNFLKANINQDHLFQNDIVDKNECSFAERIIETHSISSEENITSNSLSYNCKNSQISSLEETSNSSWNNISEGSLLKQMNQNDEPKFLRNEFPTVFNKYKTLKPHMNLCSDGDEVVIPISYVRKVPTFHSRKDKYNIVAPTETSTEYDLDSEHLNNSLDEFKHNPSDKISLSSSSQRHSSKYSYKSEQIKEDLSKTGPVTLFVYISDVHGVEESLILNKDRRFCRIMERYKCTVSIIQMNNMSRGFPHTLLKITGASKMHLQCMSRDTDKIHPQWNLRSQLRSVHA